MESIGKGFGYTIGAILAILLFCFLALWFLGICKITSP
jgi:hypothetical protein